MFCLHLIPDKKKKKKLPMLMELPLELNLISAKTERVDFSYHVMKKESIEKGKSCASQFVFTMG